VLSFVTRGSGPRRRLLLHGFLGSGRNLGALARRWSELDPQVSLLQVDLLGHGRSPPLPPGADLDTQARAVLALAAQQGLEEPLSLTGHSLGGRVALAARRLAPERVAEVTLLDIAPGPLTFLPSREVLDALLAAPASAPTREELRDFLQSRLTPALAEWLVMNLEPQGAEGWRWRIDRQALADFHRRTAPADLWDALEPPGSPALRARCLRGAESGYVRDEEAARLERAGVPVITLQGAGHFLHVDQPEQVARLCAAPP
jgi:esterase